jgi:hypothetical protein
MKRLLFLLLCCAALLVAQGARAQDKKGATPADHGGKIETRYDGAARETVVLLKRMPVTCEVAKGLQSTVKGVCVSLQASLHCPGTQLDYVRRATLSLTFETKDWDNRHPLEQRELTVVADGETLRLGRMRLAAQGVGDSWLATDSKETLEAQVSYETFRKIARASFVEISVGRTAFGLRDKNVAALRDLNSRVRF